MPPIAAKPRTEDVNVASTGPGYRRLAAGTLAAVHVGISFANVGPGADPAGAVAAATAAEAAGFESLWTVEHHVVPSGYGSQYPYSRDGRMPGDDDSPIPEPLTWLAYVAARTETIRLATGITVLPLRNPVVLAATAATVDHLSGGRLILGIGSGWLEEEFNALGVPFEGRGERTDDTIRAMRALWAESPASYEGTHASFRDVHLEPRPVRGTVPIVVGGHSRRAARRAGELGDGFFPAGRRAEIPDLVAAAREAAERAGRDPEGLEITVGSNLDPSRLEEWAGFGAHRVVLPPLDPDTISALADTVAALA
jgi:probable F420-dependent oxidoreductase